MRVVVVMPQGPREAYAAIEQAGHELVLGAAEGSRGPRPSDDLIIPLARGAHCLIYNEGSRRLMEALPELTACVATGLGYDKIDVAAANELAHSLERLEDELAREIRKRKITFAALEGVEDEFARPERWRQRIRDGDPFGASLGAEVARSCRPPGRPWSVSPSRATNTREPIPQAVHPPKQTSESG